MNEVADFILRYPLIYRKWERQTLLDWLQWHADHQLLLKAIDFDGNIAGVMIIRTVMKPEDANEDYLHDPEGSVAYIELAIAAKRSVLGILTLAALHQFGHRDWIAWKRPPYFVTRFRKTKRVLSKILGEHAHV